jgi:hypothetical protein
MAAMIKILAINLEPDANTEKARNNLPGFSTNS